LAVRVAATLRVEKLIPVKRHALGGAHRQFQAAQAGDAVRSRAVVRGSRFAQVDRAGAGVHRIHPQAGRATQRRAIKRLDAEPPQVGALRVEVVAAQVQRVAGCGADLDPLVIEQEA